MNTIARNYTFGAGCLFVWQLCLNYTLLLMQLLSSTAPYCLHTACYGSLYTVLTRPQVANYMLSSVYAARVNTAMSLLGFHSSPCAVLLTVCEPLEHMCKKSECIRRFWKSPLKEPFFILQIIWFISRSDNLNFICSVSFLVHV